MGGTPALSAPVILALMPLGVEHPSERSGTAPPVPVILALMPLGVEHVSRAMKIARTPKLVILALMPLGVEHIPAVNPQSHLQPE